VLGGVKAREHNSDIVGFITLALVSGLGGGIIRDTLLQHGPPLALTHPSYLATALGGALVAYLVRIRGPVWEHSYRMVDALAIGCWAAARAAHAAGRPQLAGRDPAGHHHRGRRRRGT
jgi:uncharacterized membrane protein YeiH